MDKETPFHIHAAAQGQTALIRITGSIGWDVDSEGFRGQIDAIVRQGVTNAHLYLHGPGGSCFDAEEIVNIIRAAFTGSVTGEGGALVASAYTRIAMACDTFAMPENGMFMIHKPSGYAGGTADRIEAYLKLLQNIEAQYLATYKEKSVNTVELEKQWQKGDWWMTAKEAKENGFVTEVKGKAKIDAATTALISACGCPAGMLPNITNQTKILEMDLKTTARMLGLPESATEAEITAAIENGRKASADLEAMRRENEQKAEAEKVQKIKAALDLAIAEKRITADMRGNWEKMLAADFETAHGSLMALSPVKKIEVNRSPSGTEAAYQGKSFKQLQEENPELLADLEKNDPESFEALFKASFK